MVYPNPLSPTPSTFSAKNTTDPQSLGPLASLAETEQNPENKERKSDAPDQATEGDIEMECSE